MKNRASSAVFRAIIQKVGVFGGGLRRHYLWIGVSVIALLFPLGLHFTHQLKYYPLIHALADRQWVRADLETLNLFETYRFPKEKETYLDSPAPLYLSAIPCDELKAVDKLWLKYSDGRFGLSVQTRILKATGNDPKKLHWERYAQFEKAVGWPHIDSDHYDRADPKTLPQGHFPYNLGFSYETYGSGFNRTWRLEFNPDCGFY
jgi:hypothetical protein